MPTPSIVIHTELFCGLPSMYLAFGSDGNSVMEVGAAAAGAAQQSGRG